ncbi:hypothetical protein V6Z11_A04G020700 [Gossypium hirsutum]
MLKELFIGITEVPFICAEEVSLWVLAAMKDVGLGFLIGVGFAAFSFVFALVGAMKGQTTETGSFSGTGLGAVAGATTALQLLESLADGELLSQITLLVRLVSEKVFIAWVNSAMLKAFQWEMEQRVCQEVGFKSFQCMKFKLVLCFSLLVQFAYRV